MPDKRIVDRLSRIIKTLSVEALLFDMEGNAIAGGKPLPVPTFDPAMEWLVSDGSLWMRTAVSPIAYVCVRGDTQATVDTAKLIVALVDSLAVAPPVNDRLDMIRSVLREELSVPEIEALSQEYAIPTAMGRCVILFHGASPAVKELIPVDDNDILVEMDRHALVLVKSMDNMEGYEDLVQWAEAMDQTIMSETGEQLSIGIGEIKSTMTEIGQSYRAAFRALEIGRIYHPEKRLFAFDRLVLERFLSEISHELGTRYNKMLFNRKMNRLFNEEMLHTIEVFLSSDLSLSSSARQLSIHRNTLVYRLNKIQLQTGLDLRRFNDAITFQMLLMLGKCAGNMPAPVR